MNSVERVKSLCKKRRIPISRLEKDLGYSNGYIGQLRKGVFPSDRLQQIAKYLNVTPDYLINGSEEEKEVNEKYYLNDETAKAAQEIFENNDLRVLFDAARDASPEDLKTTYNMLMALKRKERDYDGDDTGC